MLMPCWFIFSYQNVYNLEPGVYFIKLDSNRI
jgi:hypothetical protein